MGMVDGIYIYRITKTSMTSAREIRQEETRTVERDLVLSPVSEQYFRIRHCVGACLSKTDRTWKGRHQGACSVGFLGFMLGWLLGISFS